MARPRRPRTETTACGRRRSAAAASAMPRSNVWHHVLLGEAFQPVATLRRAITVGAVAVVAVRRSPAADMRRSDPRVGRARLELAVQPAGRVDAHRSKSAARHVSCPSPDNSAITRRRYLSITRRARTAPHTSAKKRQQENRVVRHPASGQVPVQPRMSEEMASVLRRPLLPAAVTTRGFCCGADDTVTVMSPCGGVAFEPHGRIGRSGRGRARLAGASAFSRRALDLARSRQRARPPQIDTRHQTPAISISVGRGSC